MTMRLSMFAFNLFPLHKYLSSQVNPCMTGIKIKIKPLHYLCILKNALL